MFPTRFFNLRYFAARFWPKVGAELATPTFGCCPAAMKHSRGAVYAMKFSPRAAKAMRTRCGAVAAEKGC